jgi:hypothetical protein
MRSWRGKWLNVLAMIAVVLAPVGGVRARRSGAGPKRGDAYELTLIRDTAQRESRGGTSTSHDEDTLIERVVEVRADGLELEYDLPSASPDRASEWHFPARVFRPSRGPMQLLNRAELEARVDGWLKGGGLSRANCGKLIFTWTAIRIDCDPQSVIKMIERFDLTSLEAREGATYVDPNAVGPAPLGRGSSERTFAAEMAVNPDAVRRGRAETDVGVANLMQKPLTLEEALRERARDTVSGTISVVFEVDPAGDVRRRTTVAKVEIGRPDGRMENQTTTETLERRLIPRRGS